MTSFNTSSNKARTEVLASLKKTSAVGAIADNDHRTIASVTATATSYASLDGRQLLKALWRTPSSRHHISVRDKKTNKFTNISVNNNDEAVDLANFYSNSNCDVYFSCSEFRDSSKRTAANAIRAWALWMDLDCGVSKAAKNLGYLNCYYAVVALKKFCGQVGIDLPTHIVCSGSGLHVYWVLDKCLEKESWQAYAKKLKALANFYQFLADPCRTSDIASLLRIPGTLNFKSAEPKPVTLLHTSDHFLTQENVLTAIDSAWQQLNKTTIQLNSHGTSSVEDTRSNDADSVAESGWLDLDKLASALSTLDPDCDETIWTLRRIAPMAREAKKHPKNAEKLYQLCRYWSSGKLRGVVSKKWVTPGGNGITGKHYFDTVWDRFLRSNYAGKRATISSIYLDASNADWVAPDEQFEIIATDIKERK